MSFVYRFKDKKTEKVIYVGKTKRALESRINEHFGGKGHLPKKCYKSVGRVEYLTMKTEADALLVENYFINKYKPVYNKKDKVDSELTYHIQIDDDWKLLRTIHNDYSNMSFSDLINKILAIAFWGIIIWFFIIGAIAMYT